LASLAWAQKLRSLAWFRMLSRGSYQFVVSRTSEMLAQDDVFGPSASVGSSNIQSHSVPHLRITITHQQETYSCPKQSPHSIHLDSETTPLLLLRLLSWSYETVRLGSRGAVQLPSSRVSRASLRLCRFYSSRDPKRSIYMLRRLCVPRKLP
jgi:hypothetical protein